jgi:putative component of toxin-antitoxin plasmid stabilization module
VLELRYYLAVDGKSPFEEWFSGLDAAAGAKVSVVLARVEQGNLSNAKGVGDCSSTGSIGGLLLIGGTKKRQQRDIEQAKVLWADYKRRRKQLARWRSTEARNGTDTEFQGAGAEAGRKRSCLR